MKRLVHFLMFAVWLVGAVTGGLTVQPDGPRTRATAVVADADRSALGVQNDRIEMTVCVGDARWQLAVPIPAFVDAWLREGTAPSLAREAPSQESLLVPLYPDCLHIMIQLRNITKSYRNGFSRTFVLRRIDLEIDEGEFVTIQGPSGAGKTTLLHIMGLLDEPSDGEYHFAGEPTHKMSEDRRTEIHRSQIGFVFQAYHLIDDLTVYENLETPLIYKGLSGSERKSKVADMLDRFSLVAKKDLFPN